VLGGLGVEVVEIEADERFPDCCFVEDPALVVDDYAVITRMGPVSRRGEGEGVSEVLSRFGKRIAHIVAPGTLEGGDVLRIGDSIFVGLTERTNREGIDQLQAILDGYRVIPVELQDTLHLKSVSAVGKGYVILTTGHFDDGVFAEYDQIEIPRKDEYSVNCIDINGTVVMAEGYPETREKIEQAGLETIEVPVSEFRKADGGLSCLSIRF